MSDALADPRHAGGAVPQGAGDVSRADRRRSLLCLGAALLVHVLILAALALGFGSLQTVPKLPPVTIELQSTAREGPIGGLGNAGTVAEASGGGGASTPAAAASAGSDSSGFVIPTPGASTSGTAMAPSGPSFRESGGTTGVAPTIPSTPSRQPGPLVPPVARGGGTGTASASGSGASSVQRSGTGVLVGGSTQPSGSLDLSQLDKSLAADRSSGGPGGAGSQGNGSGGGTNRGGTGSGPGVGGSGAAGGGGISWTGPPRTLKYAPDPRVPAWVSQQALTLSVRVTFIVLPEGVTSGVAIKKSSGFADVDTACVDAVRRWRFTPSDGAAPVRGEVPITIRP